MKKALILITILVGAYFVVNKYYPNYLQKFWPQNSLVNSVNKMDETVNWKTYKNEERKYEFRYPNNWVMVNGDFMPADKSRSCANREVNIDVDDCVLWRTFEVSNGRFDYYGAGSGLLIEKKIADLTKENYGNNEFNVLYNEFEAVGSNYYFISNDNNRLIGFEYWQRYDKNRGRNEVIIKQILSTFKFTK